MEQEDNKIESNPSVLPTLGMLVTPEYSNRGGVIPVNQLRNENILVEGVNQIVFPLGFTKQYFKSELEQEIDERNRKAESDYKEEIRAGLGPLNAYNQNNSYPTNFNWSSEENKNLNLSTNNIPYIFSGSWSGQNISRSDYTVNQGNQLVMMEQLARGDRLW